MAASKVTLYDQAILKIGAGVFDFASDDFCVILTTKDQPVSGAFTGTSGTALYSDLTDEVVGAGYTAEGVALTGVTWSLAGADAKFEADAAVWSGLTATMKYAHIAKVESGNPTHLLAFVDLEELDADGRSTVDGDFVITWTGDVFRAYRQD